MSRLNLFQITMRIVRLHLFFQLASSLDPVEVKSGSALSIVNASLIVKDNKYILEVILIVKHRT